MNFFIRALAIGALAVSLAGSAHADSGFAGGPSHGSHSYAFLGNITFQAKDNQNGQATLQTGFYQSEHIEYGFSLGGSYRSTPANPAFGVPGHFISAGQIGTLARYHFTGDRVVPYVGIYPNYAFGRGSKGTPIIIGAVGADIFIQPQVSLVAEIAAVRSTDNAPATVGELNIGLKVFSR